jgi:hypothetical protein
MDRASIRVKETVLALGTLAVVRYYVPEGYPEAPSFC